MPFGFLLFVVAIPAVCVTQLSLLHRHYPDVPRHHLALGLVAWAAPTIGYVVPAFAPLLLGDFLPRIAIAVIVPFAVFSALWWAMPQLFPPLETRKNAKAATAAWRHLVAAQSAMYSAGWVASLLLTIAISSHYSAWCCISTYHQETLCTTFEMIRGVLDEARIPYFVCFGTALLSLRDAHRPYQTIPWEHDLDVCIQWQDFDRFRAAVTMHPGLQLELNPATWQQTVRPNAGLPAVDRFRMGRGYVDVRLYGPPDKLDVAHATTDPKDPVRVSYKFLGDGKYEPWPSDAVHEHVGFPKDYVPMKVCNVLANGPSKPKDYALAMFGQRAFEGYVFPSNIQGDACRLVQDCAIPEAMLPGGSPPWFVWAHGVPATVVVAAAVVVATWALAANALAHSPSPPR